MKLTRILFRKQLNQQIKVQYDFETEKIDDNSNECDIESLISKPFNRDIDRQSKRSKTLMIDLPVFNLSRENTIFTHYSEK